MKGVSPRQARESRGHSQVAVAAAMRISQPAVSKLERRTDISIVALGDYIAALGGELEVSARFSDGVVPLAVGRAGQNNEVMPLASPEIRYAQSPALRKVADRPAFVMPDDWAAEVIRIRAMTPERRLEELANASAFFAAAKRRD